MEHGACHENDDYSNTALNLNKPKFVTNMRHQHALVLVGRDTIFGVHMTQYHHEEHKYQMIVELELPEEVRKIYHDLRQTWPEMAFVLCNAESDLFMVPEIGGGSIESFRANIFMGLFPLDKLLPEEEENEHFFPWAPSIVKPVNDVEFEVTVKRVVQFRPFNHQEILPKFANYYVWGDGNEAHMTHWQTAHLASGPFDAPAFGPDYDHIMTLKHAPNWLDAPLLKAGVSVSVPAIKLRNAAKKKKPDIPQVRPFKHDGKIEVLYRGIGQPYEVIAGYTFVFGPQVASSPSTIPELDPSVATSNSPDQMMFMPATPKEYWADARLSSNIKDEFKDE